ncbi:hypothetical protein DENIT_140052 [Pseudomonas veronii]|nr:hypothetical protein DENIT_140052 [Pseudomonas veronii]
MLTRCDAEGAKSDLAIEGVVLSSIPKSAHKKTRSKRAFFATCQLNEFGLPQGTTDPQCDPLHRPANGSPTFLD